MVGPGARKPSVGEGIESRRPLFCSGITTLHSLFIYLFFLSFIFTFASILVCVNNWRAGASLPSRPNGAIFLYILFISGVDVCRNVLRNSK